MFYSLLMNFAFRSTGIFIYIYSIFYYQYYSLMTGLLQGSFYFAYMLVVCYFFFILLGSVGFFSALIFVRRIYRKPSFGLILPLPPLLLISYLLSYLHYL